MLSIWRAVIMLGCLLTWAIPTIFLHFLGQRGLLKLVRAHGALQRTGTAIFRGATAARSPAVRSTQAFRSSIHRPITKTGSGQIHPSGNSGEKRNAKPFFAPPSRSHSRRGSRPARWHLRKAALRSPPRKAHPLSSCCTCSTHQVLQICIRIERFAD